MLIVVKKREIEVVKFKIFVYIVKDEILYIEIVDVKVREMVIDDFFFFMKCLILWNMLVKEKGEIIKFSDDLEFLIFVYKSFEEDVFLSCVLDDQ